MENSMAVPPKIKTELPHDPAVPLRSACVYPKELTAGSRKGICTSVFTAALFTTAKMEKATQTSTDR